MNQEVMNQKQESKEDLVLTDKQIAVLTKAANGHCAKSCGKALGISAETVKSHLEFIRKKLRARTTTHAVFIATKSGLL